MKGVGMGGNRETINSCHRRVAKVARESFALSRGAHSLHRRPFSPRSVPAVAGAPRRAWGGASARSGARGGGFAPGGTSYDLPSLILQLPPLQRFFPCC